MSTPMRTSRPARPGAAPARPYHFPRFERRKLVSGLNLLVAHVPKLPLVSVVAIIDAGAVSEDPGEEGIADLVANTMREGTARLSGSEITEVLERLGTSLAAGADWETTTFSMTVLRENLGRACEIFAEVLTSPSFPENEAARLKAEHAAARHHLASEPRALAEEAFSRVTYADTARYGTPVHGTLESVAPVTRDSMVRFYRAHYRPATTTLVFAGDITPADAESLSQAMFSGSEPAPASGRIADAESAASHNCFLVAQPQAAQAELRVGHAGVPRLVDDYFDIVVMNAVLGGLFSSRINLNLREVHGYTYGASSYFDWRRRRGPFVISTAVQSEVAGAALREIFNEVTRMRTAPIDESELSLATSYLAGVFPIRYETTAAIAAALANLVTFSLPEDYFDTYRERISAVTAEGVLRAAVDHVRPSAFRITVAGDPDVIGPQLEEFARGDVQLLAPIELR